MSRVNEPQKPTGFSRGLLTPMEGVANKELKENKNRKDKPLTGS